MRRSTRARITLDGDDPLAPPLDAWQAQPTPSQKDVTHDHLHRSDPTEGDAVEAGATDLSIIDQLVSRAAQTGLDVRLRIEGNRSMIDEPAARNAYLVVREGPTG